MIFDQLILEVIMIKFMRIFFVVIFFASIISFSCYAEDEKKLTFEQLNELLGQQFNNFNVTSCSRDKSIEHINQITATINQILMSAEEKISLEPLHEAIFSKLNLKTDELIPHLAKLSNDIIVGCQSINIQDDLMIKKLLDLLTISLERSVIIFSIEYKLNVTTGVRPAADMVVNLIHDLIGTLVNMKHLFKIINLNADLINLALDGEYLNLEDEKKYLDDIKINAEFLKNSIPFLKNKITHDKKVIDDGLSKIFDLRSDLRCAKLVDIKIEASLNDSYKQLEQQIISNIERMFKSNIDKVMILSDLATKQIILQTAVTSDQDLAQTYDEIEQIVELVIDLAFHKGEYLGTLFLYTSEQYQEQLLKINK